MDYRKPQKNQSGWTFERCTFQMIWMHYSLSQQAQSYWRCLFWLHWSRFDSRQEHQTYLSSKTSRQALKPTQPPIPWAMEALCLGVKLPGHEADHSLKSIAQIKNEWSYTSNPPTGLHGMYTGQLLPIKNTVVMCYQWCHCTRWSILTLLAITSWATGNYKHPLLDPPHSCSQSYMS
jgi:hypothetical protein